MTVPGVPTAQVGADGAAPTVSVSSSPPFLSLQGFTALWDGAPLTTQQQAMVTLLLTVASDWIYQQSPGRSPTDPAAQFVVYDVVSNAVRYQKYGRLQSFSKTTGHRMDGGSFAGAIKALEFTDEHKQMLGLALRALPMSSCRPNDWDAQDRYQGWDTPWSNGTRNQGWNFWEYGECDG